MTEEKKVKELHVYVVFCYQNPPQRFVSSENLLESYRTQFTEGVKLIEFKDEDGSLIAAYHPNAILGVVQGDIVPSEKEK